MQVWKQQLENRVLALVDQVVSGRAIEDALVECKGVWPAPPAKVARQLAAHANAAGHEPILWIIGLDDKRHQVTTAADVELADWWAQVVSVFDEGIAPGLESLGVPVGGGQSVVALRMTTDRAPYVVKRQDQQGPFEREVPWREGNRTRSAHRNESLKLLVPAVQLPEVTVVRMALDAFQRLTPGSPNPQAEAPVEELQLGLHGKVFVVPRGQTVVLPGHLIAGELLPDAGLGGKPDGMSQVPLPAVPVSVSFSNPSPPPLLSGQVMGEVHLTSQPLEPHPMGVDVRQKDIYVMGPGSSQLSGTGRMAVTCREALQTAERLRVRITLPVAGVDQAVTVETVLEQTSEGLARGQLARWQA
jgi:hypothetical protein